MDAAQRELQRDRDADQFFHFLGGRQALLEIPALKSLIDEIVCEVIRKPEIQAALVRGIVNRLRPQFGTPASTLHARLAEIGDEERLEELVKVAVCQTIKDFRSNLSAFAPRGEKA